MHIPHAYIYMYIHVCIYTYDIIPKPRTARVYVSIHSSLDQDLNIDIEPSFVIPLPVRLSAYVRVGTLERFTRLGYNL